MHAKPLCERLRADGTFPLRYLDVRQRHINAGFTKRGRE